MFSVLVTGCMGFIGAHVTARLLNEGKKVIGFDNLANPCLNPSDFIKASAKENWENFKFYKIDIRDLNTMISICLNEKIDSIIHLAAVGSITRSFETPHYTVDVNERGFANILSLSETQKLKRLIFASSSSVYGDSQKKIKVEGEEGFPLSPYSLSKQQNEKLAKIWSNKTGLEYIGLRFFNVYGPLQNPDSPYSAVIPRFCNDKELTIYGDGETIRDFTYVSDAVQIISKSIWVKNHNFVVNVGSGKEIKIKELAQKLSFNRNIVHAEKRSGETKESVASINILKSIYKTGTTSLDFGIIETKNYYDVTRNTNGFL
jgi:UDP-N-acetylglucosamine 4-epimerase